IIHSPQLVHRLEEKGVRVVAHPDEISEQAVIVRSHGVTSTEMAALAEKNVRVVDATCPFVKKAQEYAATLSEEGYHLIVVGEAEHPEVQGIVSYAEKGRVSVVAEAGQVAALGRFSRLALVAQTTQSFDNFRQIVEACLPLARELRVFNTICNATSVRQKEARQIASQVELMLVVGGYNSANTTRLAQICKDIQPRTYHVETAEDLDPAWFQGVERIGITAGASTPDWLIEQVVDRVTSLTGGAG
ncbi:MAG: 4-hydroxy-3-methylbut-2-enyl diphosphate reductase, partial [Deltaproteobacteria bacterium]